MNGLVRFHVERDAINGAWRVWAWRRYGGDQNIDMEFDAKTGRFTESSEPLAYGAQPESPSAVLPDELVDALLDAVRGVRPGDVLADSVADARKTRDDVLSLHSRTVDFIMRTAHRDFSS